LIVRPEYQAESGILHDYSVRGLGLLVTRELDRGSVLAIRLRRRHAGLSGILTGKVCHVQSTDRGYWLVGCRLSRCLAEDEFEALLNATI
jgi:hypothetical protein